MDSRGRGCGRLGYRGGGVVVNTALCSGPSVGRRGLYAAFPEATSARPLEVARADGDTVVDTCSEASEVSLSWYDESFPIVSIMPPSTLKTMAKEALLRIWDKGEGNLFAVKTILEDPGLGPLLPKGLRKDAEQALKKTTDAEMEEFRAAYVQGVDHLADRDKEVQDAVAVRQYILEELIY